MVTIMGSSKDGGRAEAETDRQIQYSEESTTSLVLANALSTLVMSEAKTTLQTSHREASTHHPTISSQKPPSQMTSPVSLPTSMLNPYPLNSMLVNAVLSPHHSQNQSETTQTPRNNNPPSMNSRQRCSFTKRKTSDNHGGRSNALPQPIHSSTPAAYSANLTPQPSPLRPHCLSRERLRLWKPACSC